jgi:membrane protease YdiL (CAAX protease family)
MKNPGVMIAVSSILFGLSHWSGGLNIIITATLWAVLPMYVMVRTGSVVPALVAHFVTDFVAFV